MTTFCRGVPKLAVSYQKPRIDCFQIIMPLCCSARGLPESTWVYGFRANVLNIIPAGEDFLFLISFP